MDSDVVNSERITRLSQIIRENGLFKVDPKSHGRPTQAPDLAEFGVLGGIMGYARIDLLL